MIKGVHTMFYSPKAEELRAFIRDKLGFPYSDVGDGWLIFFVTGLIGVYSVIALATRWLNDLTNAARGIAHGEYKQDLSHLYNIPVYSEISELAEAIEESGRVHIREQVLIERVHELEIKVDEAKKQQVEEIVVSQFFQDLKSKAAAMRRDKTNPPPSSVQS